MLNQIAKNLLGISSQPTHPRGVVIAEIDPDKTVWGMTANKELWQCQMPPNVNPHTLIGKPMRVIGIAGIKLIVEY